MASGLQLGAQNVPVQAEQVGGVYVLDVSERWERVHLRFGVPNVDLDRRDRAPLEAMEDD